MLGVVRSCASLAADVRIDRVEMPLARLLRLLAGHPSLHPDEGNEAGLRMTGQFIEMFLDCVARRDNVSLLFTIANKLKTVCVIGEDIDDDKLRLFADCANQRATADSDDETEWEREAALSPSIVGSYSEIAANCTEPVEAERDDSNLDSRTGAPSPVASAPVPRQD